MKTNLNTIKTFENFIGKNSNAYKAATMVGSNSRDVSPLFIWGNVGTGKTHLLHAIGNQMLEQNTFSKVLFTNAELFTNELIQSLRSHGVTELKEKYHGLDLLLFDDLQELESKDTVQNELLAIIKYLLVNNKTVVFGSALSINDLRWIDREFKSYITSGVVVKSDESDSIDKKDILLLELDKIGVENEQYTLIKDKVIPYLVNSEVTDMRELIGCLKRTVFFVGIMGEDLDESTLKQMIGI